MRSPSNLREQFNNNLPLDAIPETRESMLEENSGYKTVKTNKFVNMITNN